MGIDGVALDFLLNSMTGADTFKRVVMVGRQQLQHLDATSLRSLLNTKGVTASLEDSRRILEGFGGFADGLFRHLGAERVDSIDLSDYEGASIRHDMNLPIPGSLNRGCTAVIDGGCLEHVFNFPIALRNCMELLDSNGLFVSITVANNFMGHGFYQFSPELFFRTFSPENGFETKSIVLHDSLGGSCLYEVKDPRSVRTRVEAITTGPITMLVRARRTSLAEPFSAVFPLQSDYQVAWQRATAVQPSAAPETHVKVALRSRFYQLIRRLAPDSWKKFYRDIKYRKHEKQFDANCFTRIK